MIGFIYIMSNPAHPDIQKIGQTFKDPEERRKELSSTGVLEEFELEYRALSEDYESLEREIHKSLSLLRYRKEREFFTISIPEAINKVREIAGDRIEGDRVFYVSPEDLLRSEEERLKKAEKDRIAFEARSIQMEKEIKERRLLAAAEAQKKVDRAKFKEAEDIRIKALKEDERIRVEKEKEEEEKKEKLEQYKNLFRPPKNIIFFSFWISFLPTKWALYGIGEEPNWKLIFYIPVGLIGAVWSAIPLVGVLFLSSEFLNFIGMG